MILFKRAAELMTYLEQKMKTGTETGFIPTMGALHEGHISLIRASKEQAGLTICSIFVNPTQFNDKQDFHKYPITLEKDIYMLEKNGTDILFLPQVEEIYPAGTTGLEHYDLGYLETILEGKYRPGHFQGVCQVMHRLLGIIQPTHLFMGQKDYQQCMVIKKMCSQVYPAIQFHTCATLREPDGLAMSSRNMRLSNDDRVKATAIYRSLLYIKNNLRKGDISDIVDHAKELLLQHDFKIDYVDVAAADNLEIISHWDGSQEAVALVAAFQHEVRLIDNMLLT